MNVLVVDTHAILWFLLSDPRLSVVARNALRVASDILLPSICLVEIIYLIDKGKFPNTVLDQVIAELNAPASPLKPIFLDLDIARAVANIPRAVVPDLPDRVIAATALQRNLPLVSRDRKIALSSITTIW